MIEIIRATQMIKMIGLNMRFSSPNIPLNILAKT